jgi:hypothetical protein
MEIDEDQASLAATRLRPKSVEDDLEIITEKKTSVEPLSEKETIATLVKAHVALRD